MINPFVADTRHALMITSVSEGHVHTWEKHCMFTSINDGHKHRVWIGRTLPVTPGGHVHLLLNQAVR